MEIHKPAYENLKFYQNICELRKSIYAITARFEKTHIRLASQMRDAARSAKQNIREGYRRGSTNEFARSIRISQGSLEELGGDIEDCYEDGLINKEEFDSLSKIINSATFLSGRYLVSLEKLKKSGKWKVPFFM